ncbi:MAG TPA: hypothetical protein EYP14_02010, partial [Planctomycetaceae bacterium]|nr:hypothetical protein [Planctomycetaceae bacterium]
VLKEMTVRDGRLVLPSGMSYRLLALPQVETMTPRLLAKIKELVEAGATVVGAPPWKSPSLSGYPKCDAEVERLAGELWPGRQPPSEICVVGRGQGRIVWGGELTQWCAAERPWIPRLDRAKWIWHDGEGDPARAVPPGVRYFRRAFQLDADRRVRSAQLVITADNSFVCWINGRRVLTGNTFRHTFSANVARVLKPGRNVIAVEARNAANAPNPAGLIAVLEVRLDDGSTFVLPTDGSWTSGKEVPDGWASAPKGPAQVCWTPVRVLGPPGIAPWGDVEESDSSSDLYPDVLALSRLLERLGVPPDFDYRTASGERSLRFIHRRIGDTDVYFVANKRPEAEAAVCRFRVSGRRPELWWPRSGRIDRPAVYDEIDGRLCLPLSLEAHESVFVVFREGETLEPDRVISVTRNGQPLIAATWPPAGQPLIVPEAHSVRVTCGRQGQYRLLTGQPGRYELKRAGGQTRSVRVESVSQPIRITGPWQVRFTPGWGAPERVTFEKLVPWNEHTDPGGRYYSGAATYTTRFSILEPAAPRSERLILDLGRVEVMARVKLNGRDLGTLWKPPYEIDITGTARIGENLLELTVVNLWINRLIGDEQLPEDSERTQAGDLTQWPRWLLDGQPSPAGRYTFTTWRLWKKDSPLVPPGLLGPVTIRSLAQELIRR